MAQVSTYVVSRIVMVVIGVLVAAAIVIGVIYLLEHRGAQVRHDQSSQIAAQELKQQQQSSDKASTGTSTKPVSAPSTSAATTTTVATTASPEALPTTGMSDSVAPILILAVLAFATTSYVVSRRSVKAL